MAHEAWLTINSDNKKFFYDRYGYLIIGKQNIDCMESIEYNALTKEAVKLIINNGFDLNVLFNLNNIDELQYLIKDDLFNQVQDVVRSNSEYQNLEGFFCNKYMIGYSLTCSKDYKAIMMLLYKDFDSFMFEEMSDGDNYCLCTNEGAYWETFDHNKNMFSTVMGPIGSIIQEKRKLGLHCAAEMGIQNYEFSYMHYTGE